jgi:hypothetical protein
MEIFGFLNLKHICNLFFLMIDEMLSVIDSTNIEYIARIGEKEINVLRK